ncbi:rod shape-determining protein MreC [Comamonas sp. Y33R10-2]|uniref:rod shape-determining protein MreC n=1 Tax=Comamonas sp. Y33R10-2 TaxID=2853257 RepID=UPI001C5C8B2F|nr:rod shape-determining protein MreC [Comamonas sp. Y33R10-2]QXZ08885.1 rod shape-determining protein MreC [Comamonas sp. Y33R10-2]
MSLDTLDHRAPSLFKQQASRTSQLALYSALALFLMVADARFKITKPVRSVVSAVLAPVQWVVAQPVLAYQNASRYLEVQQQAVASEDAARKELVIMAQRAELADELMQENEHLRALLELKGRNLTPGQVAEVVYDSPDPYTRRVVIDKGQVDNIALGSPVLDEQGVIGQVTRVYPTRAEVALLIDRDQAIPVFNPRTGARSVAYGDASTTRSGGMELRFMPSNADVQVGDLLTTSGIDGLYPAGLPVAKVMTVERRADSAFSRIYCEPVGRVQGVRHVMVLKPKGRTEHPEAANMQVQVDAEKADRAAKARGKNEKAAADKAAAEKKAAEAKAEKAEKAETPDKPANSANPANPAKDPA